MPQRRVAQLTVYGLISQPRRMAGGCGLDVDTVQVLPNPGLQTTAMLTDQAGERRHDKRQKHSRACEFCRRRKGAPPFTLTCPNLRVRLLLGLYIAETNVTVYLVGCES